MLNWLLGRLLPRNILHAVQNITPEEKAILTGLMDKFAPGIIAEGVTLIGDAEKVGAFVGAWNAGGKAVLGGK